MKMEKLYYINSSLVKKAYRKDNPYFLLVRVFERLEYGKAKVDCYWFDIPCAYYAVSLIGSDIVDEKDIKELNWDNLLNDVIKKGHSSTKYWVLWFLYRFYDYSALTQTMGSDLLDVYCNKNVIATIDSTKFNDYSEQVLKEIEIILDDMIKKGIECENCIKLKEKIKTKEFSMTTEDELRMKGLID